MSYPTTTKEREAFRQRRREEAAASAIRKVERLDRSPVCTNEFHPESRHVTCIGRRQPERCLCECHDGPEVCDE